MIAVKTTIPPMLGRTETEKQTAASLYTLACDYERQGKEDEATLLYRKAAQLGCPPAQASLAFLYGMGRGVEHNPALSFELYWQAASHGDPVAQRELGHLYSSVYQDVVSVNFDEAASWAMTAAWINPDACYDLAELCGTSTPLYDPEQARYWQKREEAVRDDDALNMSQNYPAFIFRTMLRRVEINSGETFFDADDSAELFGDLSPDACDDSHAPGGGESGKRSLDDELSVGDAFDYKQHSHSKEFYRDGNLADKRFFQYGQRVYYLSKLGSRGPAKLCVSSLDGTRRQALAEVGDFDDCESARIAVNCTGIYLYVRDTTAQTHVQKYDLSGNLIENYRMIARRGKDDGELSNYYIYDHMVYCTLTRGDKELILSLDTRTGERQTVYDRASRISRLTASEDYLSFCAWYEGKGVEDDGWMLYRLGAGAVRCLSNPDCSPENALLHPKYYDENSSVYMEHAGCKLMDVQWVNLLQGIFWVQEPSPADRTATVWRARSLSDNQFRPDIPMWTVQPDSIYAYQEFFNGALHFVAPTYYQFVEADIEGNYREWELNNDGHGACEQFTVLDGRRLFLDAFCDDGPNAIYEASGDSWGLWGTDWFSKPL